MLIKTKLDKLLDFKKITLKKASEITKIDERTLEEILNRLEATGILELFYPPIFFLPTTIILKEGQIKHEEKTKAKEGKIIESYEIKSKDKLYKSQVNIIEKNNEIIYNVDYPKPSFITEEYLKVMSEKLFLTIPLETVLITEEEKKEKIYKKQIEKTLETVKDIVYNDEDAYLLAGYVDAKSFGVGELEYLLIDPEIEEICINNAFTPAIVYHRKYGWIKTNIKIDSEDEVLNLSSRIARKSGRQITLLNPLLDANLKKGERANATLYPISIRGNTLTIRKFSEKPYTIPFLIKNGTLSYEMAALLWQAVELEMNMLIVGGTASGKTTMLNAIMMLMNRKHRIITIEDTRELNLPETFENYVALITRPPNPEGLGEVKLLDLMINSLRMRPDRIVVGEIRKKEEAIVLFEAMHTGHSCYSTFHADTAYIAVKRLTEEPIALPFQELEVIDLFVTLRRDRKTGLRRVFEIGQFLSKDFATVTERIYVHRPRTDTFEYSGLPIKYKEKIALYTGMNEEEINKDLKEKEEILKYVVKNDIMETNAFINFINMYYEDKDFYEKIKKGKIKIKG